MGLRGPKVWLWRWRRNPLKRRSDTVEGWVLLGAWLLTVLVGTVTGWAAAGSVERSLARERAEWRPVRGALVERAPGRADTRATGAGERVWAEARWEAPDGTVRTGQVRVRPGSAQGAAVRVWTDPRGRMVSEPASPEEARLRALLIGVLSGACVACVPFVAGRAIRARLERRRGEQWDADWARFDPLWGHRTG
ncbi:MULTISPECIES: Rv1733c family protein [unclassified Streptomyces]|uniref:Rv1733c family protein n=1 Tax=unclassified Streptomyces TaxID=2593676 RepID=UPI003D74A472